MNAFLYEVVAEAVQRQPWYRKNANTIVAALTLIVSALSLVLALELELPVGVALALPIMAQTIGTFITKLQTNGVQLSMVDKLAATPAATNLPAASAFLPSPEVISAEVQRVQTAVHDGLAEINPAVSAELDRIRGVLNAGEHVGQHRAE